MKEGVVDIIKGLKGVVEDECGLVYQFVVKGIIVVGKIGIVELKILKDDKDGVENGWFVGYDYKNKDLFVVMMI